MTDMSAPTALVSTEFSAAPWSQVSKVLEILGWFAVVILIGTGITSIFGRADFLMTSGPGSVADPAGEFNPFDIRYYEHFLATWLHLGPSLLIMLIGPTQFIPALRKNYTKVHRMAGRAFIIGGGIGAASGFFIGVFYPFMGVDGQGFNESMATLFFATYTLFCLYRAYAAVRQKQFGAHREWMVRSFALMLAIATERLILIVLMSTTEIGIPVFFGTTFWIAGVINIAASEIWINLTRTPGNGARHWRYLDAKAAK
jgi:uncharacterized membrane protein